MREKNGKNGKIRNSSFSIVVCRMQRGREVGLSSQLGRLTEFPLAIGASYPCLESLGPREAPLEILQSFLESCRTLMAS